jgi:hypothetical protein
VGILDENDWGGKHGFPRGRIPSGIPPWLLPEVENLWNKERAGSGLPALPLPGYYGLPDPDPNIYPFVAVAVAVGYMIQARFGGCKMCQVY